MPRQGNCAQRERQRRLLLVNDKLRRIESMRADRLPRAERLVFHSPVGYRVLGAPEWARGTLVNISNTGLLFRCRQALPIGTEMEISLALEYQLLAAASDLHCGCVVVRVERENDEHCALAARITSHEILPLPGAGQA